MLVVRELIDKEEMLKNLSVLQDLYPSLTLSEYSSELDLMLPHNYGQVGVFEGDICLGLSGFWIGTKLWCGKYLELDNVVVHEDFRSKGIGSIMTEYLNQKAIDEDCNMIALDAYTTNFGAQKFYMNHGFVPKGFHFVKYLK